MSLCLYLISIMIDNLAGYRILFCKSISFWILILLLHCLLAFRVVIEKSKVIWFLTLSMWCGLPYSTSLCRNVEFSLCHQCSEKPSYTLIQVFFLLFCFVFLFLAVLGLRFCARAFSSCSKQGLLFVAVHGLLLIAVASLVAEQDRKSVV